jgi:hypothetical protein
VGVVPLDGALDLGLYPLYVTAALAGWVAGNVFVSTSRGLGKPLRRRLALAYLFGPAGLLYLLRAMAPTEVQVAAPLVPLYAHAVFAVFFVVPVTLRRPLPPPPGPLPR